MAGQKYLGNGSHEWEHVTDNGNAATVFTARLRVPGGWIYATETKTDAGRVLTDTAVFVPMPEVVKHKV